MGLGPVSAHKRWNGVTASEEIWTPFLLGGGGEALGEDAKDGRRTFPLITALKETV